MARIRLTLNSFNVVFQASRIKKIINNREGAQDCKRGGFGKAPGDLPDVLHSYYGVCGLALIGDTKDGVLALDASLSISQRSRDRLKEIQQVRGWI